MRLLGWWWNALCIVSVAYGADPTAVIVGPAQTQVGDLIVLDASSSNAIGFAWVLADSDKTFLPVESGRKVVFATGSPGRYTFILVAANSSADGQPHVALAKHVLMVGDAPPDPNPPNPPPGPNPGPDPLPPGRFGLANQARDWVALVGLTPEVRRRTSLLVANSFDTIATAIAAGTINTIPDALTKLATANNSALAATEVAAWKTAWNPKFQSAMQALDSAGKLPAIKDVADAWREIALGLRGVQ